jgi:DNA-binding NarL/FixJ family response regulator
VAIVDLDLGDGRGVDVIRHLRASCSQTQILVLTGLTDDHARGEALYEGAAGALLKSATTDELIDAIRAVSTGNGSPMRPDEAVRLMRSWIDELKAEWRFEKAVSTLTPRESDVLLAMMDGLTDEEIAARFGMSVATTRSHVRAILGKLGVESRLKAVVLAYRAGHVPVT